MPVDYDAIAAQVKGGSAEPDYDALAAQVKATPASDMPSFAGVTSGASTTAPPPPTSWWENKNIPSDLLLAVPGGALLAPNFGLSAKPFGEVKTSPKEIAEKLPGAAAVVGSTLVPALAPVAAEGAPLLARLGTGLAAAGVGGALSGAGGAVGKGIELGLKGLAGNEPPPSVGEAAKEIGTEGALQGAAGLAGEGIGRAIPAVLLPAAKRVSGAIGDLAERVGLPQAAQGWLQRVALKSVAGSRVAQGQLEKGMGKALESATETAGGLGLRGPEPEEAAGTYVRELLKEPERIWKGYKPEAQAQVNQVFENQIAKAKQGADGEIKDLLFSLANGEPQKDEIARTLGRGLIDENLKPAYSAVGPDLEVVGQTGPKSFDIVQRADGQIVGGARVRDGHLMMVAGGPQVDSPVSAGPIFKKLQELGIDTTGLPTSEYTSLGKAARDRFVNGPPNPMPANESGVLSQSAIKGGLQRAKAESGLLYQASDALNQGTEVPMEAFKDTLQAARRNASDPAALQVVSDFEKKFQVQLNRETIPYSEARAMQAELAQDLPQIGALSGNAGQGMARHLWGNLTETIKGGLSGEGLQAYEAANNYYRTMSGIFKQGVVPKLVKANPERFTQKLLATGDITPVRALKKAVFWGVADPVQAQEAQAAWDTFAAQYTQDVLLKGGSEKLGANLAKVTPQVANEIYGGAKGQQAYKNLQTIADGLKALEEAKAPVVKPGVYPPGAPPPPTVLTPGAKPGLEKLRQLDQVISRAVKAPSSSNILPWLGGAGSYLALNHFFPKRDSALLPGAIGTWQGTAALITWAMFNPARAQALSQLFRQLSVSGAIELEPELEKLLNEGKRAPITPPPGAESQVIPGAPPPR